MMMFVKKVSLKKIPMGDFAKIATQLDEIGIEYEARQSKEDKKKIDLLCNVADMTEVLKAVSKTVLDGRKKL